MWSAAGGWQFETRASRLLQPITGPTTYSVETRTVCCHDALLYIAREQALDTTIATDFSPASRASAWASAVVPPGLRRAGACICL